MDKSFLRNSVGAMIGNMLEYYDYSIYIFLVPLLSEIFFPHQDQVSALIYSYGISFTGTLARPLGGYILGSVGDRYGRKIALFYSLILMGVASLFMTFMPTYEQVGVLSPILLVFCRMMQSMSAGGELNGSAIFVIENSERKGLASGISIAFTVLGILLASLTSYLCMNSDNPHENWRYCFAIGVLISLLGFIIRRYARESREFLTLKENLKKNKLTEVPDKTKRILCTLGISGAFVAFYYFAFILMTSYLPLVSSIKKEVIAEQNNYFLVLYIANLLLSGYLSDKLSPRKIMMFSTVGIFFSSIPLIMMFNYGTITSIIITRTILTSLTGLYAGATHYILSMIFPVHMRYKYISVFYSISSSLLGSSTPIICIKLWKITNIASLPVIWMMALALIGFVSLYYAPIAASEDQPIFNKKSYMANLNGAKK